MLLAYMHYNKHRVAEIKLDIGYKDEAKQWATELYCHGISVFLGRYSIKHARWRWVKWIPGLQIKRCEVGKVQPEPYRTVNKTNATM